MKTSITIKYLQQARYIPPIHHSTQTYNPVHTLTQPSPTLSLDQQPYFGPSFLGYINQYICTPLFHNINDYIQQPVLALLLVLILFSMLFFRLAYEQHIYSIKMKVLKPYLKAQGKTATNNRLAETQLYKKAGINPLLNILASSKNILLFIAFYCLVSYNSAFQQCRFFWISDVSSYDDFIQLPFEIPYIGKHLSIIALILALVTIIGNYTRKGDQDPYVKNETQATFLQVSKYMVPILLFSFTNNRPAIIGILRLFNTSIGFAQKMVCESLVNEKTITQQLLYKMNQEDTHVSPPVSRAMSRLAKRINKGKN